MLAIFDNDGTICDTQEVEGRCYARAIEEIAGRTLSTLDWEKYVDPTSTAIVRDLLSGDAAAAEKEDQIKDRFVRLLQEEQPKYPGDFAPLAGAIEFIQRLKGDAICSVAIATGCFDTSAKFKLRCCGLDLNDFPHATASDVPRRRDIIRLAAARAGSDLSSVVYFGDALWDYRVCEALQIPMIGVGRRQSQLRGLGLQYVFQDYSNADAIIDALRLLRRNPAQGQPRSNRPSVS